MSVKLYYFDVMGRGEMIRLVFTAAGKQFEDIRISDDEWPNYKGSKSESIVFYL